MALLPPWIHPWVRGGCAVRHGAPPPPPPLVTPTCLVFAVLSGQRPETGVRCLCAKGGNGSAPSELFVHAASPDDGPVARAEARSSSLVMCTRKVTVWLRAFRCDWVQSN